MSKKKLHNKNPRQFEEHYTPRNLSAEELLRAAGYRPNFAGDSYIRPIHDGREYSKYRGHVYLVQGEYLTLHVDHYEDTKSKQHTIARSKKLLKSELRHIKSLDK